MQVPDPRDQGGRPPNRPVDAVGMCDPAAQVRAPRRAAHVDNPVDVEQPNGHPAHSDPSYPAGRRRTISAIQMGGHPAHSDPSYPGWRRTISAIQIGANGDVQLGGVG
ncbi:hypothetical protein GCM10022255_012330 [Dactylosporangium darangshiense]|uniref:Uncharacterized protein n=1 Tax=Dactylosporangium darangshiense TaxID=579108 RepID=A0ABP8CZK2_9ACTN